MICLPLRYYYGHENQHGGAVHFTRHPHGRPGGDLATAAKPPPSVLSGRRCRSLASGGGGPRRSPTRPPSAASCTFSFLFSSPFLLTPLTLRQLPWPAPSKKAGATLDPRPLGPDLVSPSSDLTARPSAGQGLLGRHLRRVMVATIRRVLRDDVNTASSNRDPSRALAPWQGCQSSRLS
jgi:hypothetical protein